MKKTTATFLLAMASVSAQTADVPVSAPISNSFQLTATKGVGPTYALINGVIYADGGEIKDIGEMHKALKILTSIMNRYPVCSDGPIPEEWKQPDEKFILQWQDRK